MGRDVELHLAQLTSSVVETSGVTGLLSDPPLNWRELCVSGPTVNIRVLAFHPHVLFAGGVLALERKSSTAALSASTQGGCGGPDSDAIAVYKATWCSVGRHHEPRSAVTAEPSDRGLCAAGEEGARG